MTTLVLAHWLMACWTSCALRVVDVLLVPISGEDRCAGQPSRVLIHQLGAIGVSAGEETRHVGWVVDALHGEVVGAHLLGEGLEEGRPRQGANVTRLGGPASEDHRDRFAATVLEAVLGVTSEALPLGQRGGTGCAG